MENKLEQLLNSLIEKGWKPRGKNAYNCCDNAKRIWYEGGEESYRDYIEITPRKLTSKESGLWQFVCEHGMVKTYMNIEHESRRHSDKKHTPVGAFDNQSYYYLIESSLKDESELEQFLLDNIKVGNENINITTDTLKE